MSTLSAPRPAAPVQWKCQSGVYPHLAVFNQSEGGECGVGAVVPWAGKLWYLTYCPHAPGGSEDKLYALDPDLAPEIRPESVGGTPANRMIHEESGQLIIGPYLIDQKGTIRTIPPAAMPGRLTGVCRHLTDPANLIYVYDMEGAFYEVNVNTLAVKRLFEKPVQGWHGKGLYQGQGRVVLSNNGEWHVGNLPDSVYQVPDEPEGPDRAGCLAEWDGRTWRLVERRQHTEVTGPGGIRGNHNQTDPLWAIGWDRRSCLLKVLDGGVWHRFRLPKANYTYDGAHGWHTEWPRIREIADGFRLLDLHGMFYRFPGTFSAANTAGIRPLSSHHQMVVDFCEWQGRTVLACNHSSHFDNPLLGRCQSNLWFLEKGALDGFGPRSGWGGPWLKDDLAAGAVSDPFLVGGFDRIALHLDQQGDQSADFALELDIQGDGRWTRQATLSVPAGGYAHQIFPAGLAAEWVRLVALQPASGVTAYFHLSENPAARPSLQASQTEIFRALPAADASGALVGGIIRPLGGKYPQEETRLHYLARLADGQGGVKEQSYVVDADLTLQQNNDAALVRHFKETLQGEVKGPDFGADSASVWIEEAGQRLRLPRGDAAFDRESPVGWPRGKREVITERSLWNVHGSFYEIPRENSFGARHLRPVCTHNRLILDYCTWRGLLVLAGARPGAASDGHFVRAQDSAAGLWFGAVDDLWKLGKPVGRGGPWLQTPVQAGKVSDPYLMTGYDEKILRLSHAAGKAVTFTVEVDPTGYNAWVIYDRFTVQPGQTLEYRFPQGYSAHWLRLSAAAACTATAQLEYC